ncbi:hypothetical protein HYDPIDRAFT_120002, partial [Hydnomerulius pinastri MD-312]
MPVLSAQIHRRLTPEDSLPHTPLYSAESAPRVGTAQTDCTIQEGMTVFDHEAAEERLGDAFDRGGFNAWAEAAMREMEAEAEVERVKRS